jgi:hypothetical protein
MNNNEDLKNIYHENLSNQENPSINNNVDMFTLLNLIKQHQEDISELKKKMDKLESSLEQQEIKIIESSNESLLQQSFQGSLELISLQQSSLQKSLLQKSLLQKLLQQQSLNIINLINITLKILLIIFYMMTRALING